jgi:hypothetical protein
MRFGLVIALVCAALFPGCQCGSSDILAELTELNGTIKRDLATSVGDWQKADIGCEFRLGDGVRSEKTSDAVLELSEGSFVRLEPETTIRFLNVPPEAKKKGATGIDVQAGAAELLVGDKPFNLLTSVGAATLLSGSRVQIRAASNGLEFKVEIGQATFFDKEDKPHVVSQGESIAISIGAAVLERLGAEPSEDAVAEKPPEPVGTDTGETQGAEEDEDTEETVVDHKNAKGGNSPSGQRRLEIGEGPDWADFSANAGDSFFVHVKNPPVALELRFEGKCQNGAVVQVGKKFMSTGTSKANVLLGRGNKRYRVRCLDEEGRPDDDSVARGRITVLRDSGVSRLPRSAPSSVVETDGRRYKVMYQNRLPNISVRWPQAPAGQKYVLHMFRGGKKKTVIPTKRPEYVLSSGELKEGVHRFRYEAMGTMSRISKTTTIQIRFDNAAPKASIAEPRGGSFKPGARVKVSGVAVPGWKVSSGGRVLEMDEQHRFKGEVSHAAAYRALPLRLSHPKRGVHYYIRRAMGPP